MEQSRTEQKEEWYGMKNGRSRAERREKEKGWSRAEKRENETEGRMEGVKENNVAEQKERKQSARTCCTKGPSD